MTRWQDDRMTGWQDDRMTGWQDYKMTRWLDDKMTRWEDEEMTRWQHDLFKMTAKKSNKKAHFKKEKKNKWSTRCSDINWKKSSHSSNSKYTFWSSNKTTEDNQRIRLQLLLYYINLSVIELFFFFLSHPTDPLSRWEKWERDQTKGTLRQAKWSIRELIFCFSGMTRLGYFHSPRNGMLVDNRRLPLAALNPLVPIYTAGWREAPWE